MAVWSSSGRDMGTLCRDSPLTIRPTVLTETWYSLANLPWDHPPSKYLSRSSRTSSLESLTEAWLPRLNLPMAFTHGFPGGFKPPELAEPEWLEGVVDLQGEGGYAEEEDPKQGIGDDYSHNGNSI